VRAPRTPEDEADEVAEALGLYLPPGKLLELHLTNNHYSMISVRRKQDGYRLRLHRMFVGAEPRIVRALARYVVHNDRRASMLLGEYIELNQHIIRQQVRRPRQIKLRAEGRHHDLKAIFNQLNTDRFDGKLEARITWGPVASRRRRRRSIKMGSFAVEDRIIRIHPALDQAHVPEYFVAWIVYHEMLHGKHEVRREDGRRRFHTKEFLEEERTFPDYERAHAWEKANLDRLLRA
jgi:predicted metal-dependent hydrolase